ncbi:hypothetical protein BG004_005410 [Podila humilis]|nr:hypothetical protein BG004_005410 [Podila humilis]
MSKDAEGKPIGDTNQDDMVQPPPPAYGANSSTYAPPSGGPSSQPPASGNTFYQAQPIGGTTYAPPAGAPQQGVYTPPPAGPYAPAGQQPPPGAPAPPTNTVIYVVDDGLGPNTPTPGFPVAMICFIFGICTWVGYLFGMCFINSKDPRERFWARMCAIMAFIWALIIIFCSIFA